MLITVTLPWHLVAYTKNPIEVFRVELTVSRLDGMVCERGYAESLITGQRLRLPPYIAEKDIAKYLQAQLGSDHAAAQGGKLD